MCNMGVPRFVNFASNNIVWLMRRFLFLNGKCFKPMPKESHSVAYKVPLFVLGQKLAERPRDFAVHVNHCLAKAKWRRMFRPSFRKNCSTGDGTFKSHESKNRCQSAPGRPPPSWRRGAARGRSARKAAGGAQLLPRRAAPVGELLRGPAGGRSAASGRRSGGLRRRRR